MKQKFYIVQLHYNCMTTVITQVRLPKGIVKEVDKLVTKGLYTNKSDVIRDAIRKLILEQQVGTLKNSSNSISEVKNARRKLSKEKINIEELNNLK